MLIVIQMTAYESSNGPGTTRGRKHWGFTWGWGAISANPANMAAPSIVTQYPHATDLHAAAVYSFLEP